MKRAADRALDALIVFSHETLGLSPDAISGIGLAIGLLALGAASAASDARAETRIGDRNKIREFVTIHRGTEGGGGVTKIGSDNLLIAGTAGPCFGPSLGSTGRRG